MEDKHKLIGRSESLLNKKESNERIFENGSKTIETSIFSEETYSSIFTAITKQMIQSNHITHDKTTNIMNFYPEFTLIYDTLTSSLSKAGYIHGNSLNLLKSYVPKEYSLILQFYASLLSDISDSLNDTSKSFSNKAILMAALGLHHAYDLTTNIIMEFLDAADITPILDKLETHFASLKTFHEFFFVILKLGGNPTLNKDTLVVLQDSIKNTMLLLKQKLQKSFKLLFESELNTQKRKLVAKELYYLLQTLAIVTIFDEEEKTDESKYQKVMEKFKEIFVLISQSPIFEKVFNDECNFETQWLFNKNKYVLTSFNQKKLSMYVQEDKQNRNCLPEFSLKYMVIYYNYKLWKLISQRITVKYDDHVLNIFTSFLHKNKLILNKLTSQCESAKVMLYLNENLYILKSYLISLCCFSQDLDLIQRLPKYDIINDAVADFLYFAVKAGMYSKVKTVKEATEVSISKPKDFVALLYKTLLLYKRLDQIKDSQFFFKEVSQHINTLAITLISRPITIEDMTCFYLCRVYFLEFMMQWNMEFLIEKHGKYFEEMRRYLEDFDDNTLESDIVKALKFRIQELALELYVKLAKIDCLPLIEATIGLINESFSKEQRLTKCFYIITCLLFRRKITVTEFQMIIKGVPEATASVTNSIVESSEVNNFIKKNGITMLFMIYRNAIMSYLQIKSQRDDYESEINNNRRITINEDNWSYMSFLKKLDENIDLCKKLLKTTESFICVLHYSVPIAKNFLEKVPFDKDFYTVILGVSFGQSLILKLLDILGQHIVMWLNKEEMIDKFAAIVNSVLADLDRAKIAFEEEKKMIISIADILEVVIMRSSAMIGKVREKLYHKGILILFLEVYKKQYYAEDTEFFLRFMKLLKLIARENTSLYETGSYIYCSIMTYFEFFLNRSCLKIETVQKIIQYLIEIGLDTDFEMKKSNKKFLIYDQSAIETYLNILVLCFKHLNEQSNKLLLSYVLSPLEALSTSFINNYTLAKISAQKLLMKILKRSTEKDFQRKISRHIGEINSIHTSAQHIRSLMKHFAKKSKHVPKERERAYFSTLLDTLIDSISGDSIRNVYFFSGTNKSYIQLKTPLVFPYLGLFWTGYIRYEKLAVSKRQCIFSFLKEKSGETKGVELYIENRRLIYYLVKLAKTNNTVRYILSTVDVMEDAWHHITMIHIANEMYFYINGYSCSLTIAMDTLSKEYNHATIGATIELPSEKKTCLFFGEMSSIYFLNPISKTKETIKELANCEQSSLSLFKAENGTGNCLMIRTQSVTQRGLVFDIHFILEPKVVYVMILDEHIR